MINRNVLEILTHNKALLDSRKVISFKIWIQTVCLFLRLWPKMWFDKQSILFPPHRIMSKLPSAAPCSLQYVRQITVSKVACAGQCCGSG
jgi:hypothetical protein